MPFEVNSPAFAEGSTIPKKYTRDGENLSPPLSWSGAPPDTRSFALICEDPDAPSGTFRHWAVGNIPADEDSLAAGTGKEPVAGCKVARNDFGNAAYDGPAPPQGHGLHHYHFVLAALDANELEISPDVGAAEFWHTVEPHILARAETVGTYQRSSPSPVP